MQEPIENEELNIKCPKCDLITIKTLGWLSEFSTFKCKCGSEVDARKIFFENENIKIGKEIEKLKSKIKENSN